jgi:hypothetical protein
MRTFWTGLLAVLLISLTTVVLAQGGQTGTVEQVDQDNGSLTISGRMLVFSESLTEIYLGERRLSAVNIDPGMVVRYTLNETGVLLRIELIGPSEMLRALDAH